MLNVFLNSKIAYWDLTFYFGSGLRVSWFASARPSLRLKRTSYCKICLHFRFIRSCTLICRGIRPDQRNPSFSPLQFNSIKPARSTITLPPCVFCFCGSTKRVVTPPLIKRTKRASKGGIEVKHTVTIISLRGGAERSHFASSETLSLRLLTLAQTQCLCAYCAIHGALLRTAPYQRTETDCIRRLSFFALTHKSFRRHKWHLNEKNKK